MRYFALLCLGLAGCAIRGPQRPHRTGWWAEFGGGAGRLRMTCSDCSAPINAPLTSSDRAML